MTHNYSDARRGKRLPKQTNGLLRNGGRAVARVAVTTLVLLTGPTGTWRVARRVRADDLTGVYDGTVVHTGRTGVAVPVSRGVNGVGLAVDRRRGVLELLRALRSEARRNHVGVMLAR